MIEGKKTAGRTRKSYIERIKTNARVKTFKKLESKDEQSIVRIEKIGILSCKIFVSIS